MKRNKIIENLKMFESSLEYDTYRETRPFYALTLKKRENKK